MLMTSAPSRTARSIASTVSHVLPVQPKIRYTKSVASGAKLKVEQLTADVGAAGVVHHGFDGVDCQLRGHFTGGVASHAVGDDQ